MSNGKLFASAIKVAPCLLVVSRARVAQFRNSWTEDARIAPGAEASHLGRHVRRTSLVRSAKRSAVDVDSTRAAIEGRFFVLEHLKISGLCAMLNSNRGQNRFGRYVLIDSLTNRRICT